MKTVFIIVLLLAALGTGMYFFKQRAGDQPGPAAGNLPNQDLLIGKWKLDSIAVGSDSSNDPGKGIAGIVAAELKQYEYEFGENGSIAISLKDSLLDDSSRYEWNRDHQLSWKENPADTTADIFSVTTLDKNNLILETSDSARLLFSRVGK